MSSSFSSLSSSLFSSSSSSSYVSSLSSSMEFVQGYEIIPYERDSMLSSLGEDTRALMKQSRHQKGDLSLNS